MTAITPTSGRWRKLFVAVVNFVLLSSMCHAWTSIPTNKPTSIHQKQPHTAALSFSPSAALATVLLSMALVWTTPSSSPAQAATALDPQTFAHEYSDPLHPSCRRHIQVLSNEGNFRYDGTAVGPKNDPVLRGCSEAEIQRYGLRVGSFEGQITGDRISAGDGVHEGVWEPAIKSVIEGDGSHLPYADVDGIRWNDGNKWIVKKDT
jgi:hypothetical protein